MLLIKARLSMEMLGVYGEVGSNKELVAVLTALRKAVEAGELDAQIEAVGAAMRKGFKR